MEQIVLKCTQKSPDRRYQSMSALIEDLKKSLISPDEDFVRVIDPEANAATRMISRDDMDQIKKQSKKPVTYGGNPSEKEFRQAGPCIEQRRQREKEAGLLL